MGGIAHWGPALAALRAERSACPSTLGARLDWLGRLSHAEAREILARAFRAEFGRDGTRCELQIAQGWSVGESNYGQSCYRNCSSGHGKTCVEVSRVCDSNNWGAVQCRAKPPCPPDCFEATDTHAAGDPYQACFRRFPTPEAGAQAFLHTLYVSNGRSVVLAAAGRGDVDATSAAGRQTKYFELPLARHQAALRKNVATVAKALGEPVCAPASTSGGGGLPLILLPVAAGIAYAGYRWLT